MLGSNCTGVLLEKYFVVYMCMASMSKLIGHMFCKSACVFVPCPIRIFCNFYSVMYY